MEKSAEIQKLYPIKQEIELPIEPGFTVSEYPTIKHFGESAKQVIRIRRTNPGLRNTDIAKIMGVSPQYIGQVLKKAKAADIALTSEEMIEQAGKTLKAHIKGEMRGCVEPTAASQMQAAQMVFDRAEPKVNINKNLNANADLEKLFDLSAYRTKP